MHTNCKLLELRKFLHFEPKVVLKWFFNNDMVFTKKNSEHLLCRRPLNDFVWTSYEFILFLKFSWFEPCHSYKLRSYKKVYTESRVPLEISSVHIPSTKKIKTYAEAVTWWIQWIKMLKISQNAILFKKRRQHRCFPVNLRAPLLQSTSE